MRNHYNCIYMYTNNINNKRYIGQAVDFNRRYVDHKKPSSNKFPIDKAIKKYGIENFSITILIENLKTQEELNYYESLFIREYNTLIANNEGYNIAEGGYNGNPLQGKTEEEIDLINEKRRQAMMGKRLGENHPMYGKHHSEEARQKISKATKGKNNPASRSVICLTTKRIFFTLKDAASFYNIKTASNITTCCRGGCKSCGNYNGKRLVWKYLAWKHDKRYRIKN